jgi:hypothetical protein
LLPRINVALIERVRSIFINPKNFLLLRFEIERECFLDGMELKSRYYFLVVYDYLPHEKNTWRLVSVKTNSHVKEISRKTHDG